MENHQRLESQVRLAEGAIPLEKAKGTIHATDERRDLVEFVKAADWLIACLRNMIQGVPVYGLPEAEASYYAHLSKITANKSS
jgi:hypothetical protein